MKYSFKRLNDPAEIEIDIDRIFPWMDDKGGFHVLFSSDVENDYSDMEQRMKLSSEVSKQTFMDILDIKQLKCLSDSRSKLDTLIDIQNETLMTQKRTWWCTIITFILICSCLTVQLIAALL